MIGKGSILYDVTAGVTIAPVSAIGRLDLERTEIETTTHGPRERRTHRVGLKRDAPVTVRLNYRRRTTNRWSGSSTATNRASPRNML